MPELYSFYKYKSINHLELYTLYTSELAMESYDYREKIIT